MDDDRTIHIELELELHGDEVRGTGALRRSAAARVPRLAGPDRGARRARRGAGAARRPASSSRGEHRARGRGRRPRSARRARSASARGRIASSPRPAAVSAAASAASAFACSSRADVPDSRPTASRRCSMPSSPSSVAEQPQPAADDPGARRSRARARAPRARARAPARGRRAPASARARCVRHGDQTGCVPGGRVRSISIVVATRLLVPALGEQQLRPADAPEPRAVGRAGARLVALERRARAGRVAGLQPREREEPGGVAHLGGHRRPPEDLALDRALERASAAARSPAQIEREPAPQVGADDVQPGAVLARPVADALPGREPLGGIAERQHLRRAGGEDAGVAAQQRLALERLAGERARLVGRAAADRELERRQRGERARSRTGPALAGGGSRPAAPSSRRVRRTPKKTPISSTASSPSRRSSRLRRQLGGGPRRELRRLARGADEEQDAGRAGSRPHRARPGPSGPRRPRAGAAPTSGR